MKMKRRYSSGVRAGFTIVEILVATAVLAILVALIAQLFSAATAVTTLGEKRMDADAQARAVFDRMAIDLGEIVQRPDVDYFLKSPTSPTSPTSPARPQPGNDQIAFYSEVPGYYPDTGSQSPMSLVAYRLKAADAELERMGKGLLWAGESGPTPMVYLPLTIEDTWPTATNQNDDPDYETIGPQVFRFEYGYVLKGRTLPDGTPLPSVLSETPWDTRAGVDHTSVEGLRDVAAIVAYIAVVGPKERVLADVGALNALAGGMNDFADSQSPGDLQAQWQAVIDGSGLPLPVSSAIRVYCREFPLGH